MSVRSSGILAAFMVMTALMSRPAQALDYAVVPFDDGRCAPDCPGIIVATGTITGREAEEFAWFFRTAASRNRLLKLLLIHSPGGNAYGGMALGAVLRSNKVTVIVGQAPGGAVSKTGGLTSGLCGSACVLVLAGGIKRIAPPGSIVAVHSARQVQTEFHDILTGERQELAHDKGAVTRMFGAYYTRMGVSARLAEVGEGTAHADAYVLSPAELKRYRLAQGGF